MSVINLTVESQNLRNSPTSYTQGFNTDLIVDYVANTNTTVDGNTLITYRIGNDESERKDIFGVTETATYIAAALATTPTLAEATLDIANADIATLNGTPIEVIAAAGTDTYIDVISAICVYDYSTGAITGNTTLDLINSTTTANRLATAATALAGGADKTTRFVAVAGASASNEGVSVIVNTGNPTMGTSAGTVKIFVKYAIYSI